MNESTFSEAEKAAMKQRAEELNSMKGVKGAAKRKREFEACLDAISQLEGLDRKIAERFHVLVTEVAPNLDPKTWYGFPSYASNGKVITFLQPSSKFGTRYTTVGFSEDAKLDEGAMWATSYAILDIDDEVEKELRNLVKKAIGE